MGKRRKAKTDSHRRIAGDTAEAYSSSHITIDSFLSQGPSAIDQGSEHQLAKVRKFWHSLSTGQCSEILTTSLDDIWAKLLDVTDDEATAKVQEGIRRLCENGSCKRWQWTTGQRLFLDEKAFRLDLRRQRIEPHLQKYIPDTGKAKMTEAKKQLQKRISALAGRVKQQQSEPKLSEVERSKLDRWRQPPRTNLANFILAALHNEHKSLYDTTIAPIIVHICSVLPQGKRHSRLKDGNGQLCLENRDLDDLPYKEFEKVDSWLESKVQDFQAAAGQEVGKEAMQHLQPFKMTDHNSKLAIRADWLHQLQVEVTLLVAGLQPVTVTEAYQQLITALLDSYNLDGKCDRVRQLMGHLRSCKEEMSRVENSEADRLEDLPDVTVIMCQLRQEIQLTHARKSNASFRCHLAQMQLCKLMNEARQIVARQNVVHKRVEALEVVMPGTPESRDLRQRMLSLGILGECQALMLDVAALDRSYAIPSSACHCLNFLPQQTNLREQDMAADKEEEYMEEHDRLLKWADFLGKTLEAFCTATSQKIAADDAIRQAVGPSFTPGFVAINTPETHALAAVVCELEQMQETFKSAVWPKLCTEQEGAKAYKASEAQLKHLEDLLAEGCAALPLLEAQLCNAACSDLEGVLMDEILLPLLRQRLKTLADDFCGVHPQAGQQPGSTSLTPIELLLAEEDQTADHSGNHDSDATQAALKADKKLAAATSSTTEALVKDYAQKYGQLMAEEAPREAAESASSAAAQAAAADAPAALSAADRRPGTASCEHFRDPYFDSRLFFDSCHSSPLHCKPSYCACYPDDFMMECASDAEARAVVKGMPNAKSGVSAAEQDAMSGDVLMPQLEVQVDLEKLICCPVSKRVLVEPVLVADGRTYNAWVMQPWLQVHDVSPCGGAMLSNKSLVPNVVVRCLVYQQFILHDQLEL
ncbi:MAG: hypothetical protein FRX49_03516 [Trebouxia sp. A1-2]|nr:MAG: hypothetical protein FRX49_03516 [Trebouxia sp. A1-2]